MEKTVYIGADHAGFELKEGLKPFLGSLGYEVKDRGAYNFNQDDDYPDFIFSVAESMAQDNNSKGIVIGGSGQGEAMAANKVGGVRAAVVYDEYSAKMSRQHNDANVMAIGARTLNIEEAKKLIKLWLETPFSNEERHIRRIKKIAEIENK